MDVYLQDLKTITSYINKQRALCSFYERNQMQNCLKQTVNQIEKLKIKYGTFITKRRQFQRKLHYKYVKSYNKVFYEVRFLKKAIIKEKTFSTKAYLFQRKLVLQKRQNRLKKCVLSTKKRLLTFNSILKKIKML